MKTILALSLFVFFALGCNTSQFTVSYEKAESLYQQKKYKESMELYQTTLALAISGIPEVLDSQLKMAYLHALNKKFPDSKRILKNLRFSIKKIPDAAQKKAALQKVEKTETEIAKLEAKKPFHSGNNYENLYNQGIKEFEKKNFVAAYQIFRKIPRYKDSQDYLNELDENLDKEAEDIFQAGFKFYAENRYKEAIKKFNDVLSVNPEHQNALDYKAKAEKKLEVLEKIK